MAIDLGTLPIRVTRPRLLDFGGELTPPLGGPVQRINRLGNRYSLAVELAPVAEDPQGREIVAKLKLAKREGAYMPWPQPGLTIGTAGTPLIKTAVSAGSTVVIKGLTAGYVIRFGQFLSFVHSGERFLHSTAAQSTADGSGDATVVLAEPLRTALSVNDVVEMAPAKISGLLASGDLEHEQMLAPFVQIAFTLTERA